MPQSECQHSGCQATELQAELDRLRAAGEDLVQAYRERYAKHSTDGLRSNAPLRSAFAAFNAVLKEG